MKCRVLFSNRPHLYGSTRNVSLSPARLPVFPVWRDGGVWGVLVSNSLRFFSFPISHLSVSYSFSSFSLPLQLNITDQPRQQAPDFTDMFYLSMKARLEKSKAFPRLRIESSGVGGSTCTPSQRTIISLLSVLTGSPYKEFEWTKERTKGKGGRTGKKEREQRIGR